MLMDGRPNVNVAQQFEALELLTDFLRYLQQLKDMKFYFVGGIIRDILFHEKTRDIDLVFIGDYEELVDDLKEKYLIQSSNLLTMQLAFGRYHIDIVRARKESYPNHDGSPIVEPCSIEEDLLRRDFTINTAYAELNETNIISVLRYVGGGIPTPLEIVYAHPHFLRDINNKTLSILHDISFWEDPTRLMRLVKYQVTKQLKCDRRTQLLKNEALSKHFIRNLSQTRFMMMVKKMMEDDQWFQIFEKLVSENLFDDYYHKTFLFNLKYTRVQALASDLLSSEKLVFRLFILYDINYEYLDSFYPKAVRDYRLLDDVVHSKLFYKHRHAIEVMLRKHILDIKEAIALWQLSQYKRTIQRSVFYAYIMNQTEKQSELGDVLTWIASQKMMPPPVLTGYDLMAIGVQGKDIAIYQGFLDALNLSRFYNQKKMLTKEEAYYLIKNKPIE